MIKGLYKTQTEKVQEIERLRQQLAAAVEALETVRVKIRTHTETITQRVSEATAIIDAALAKYQESIKTWKDLS